jgi:hypothetical protein
MKVSGFWIMIFLAGETSGTTNLVSAVTGESEIWTALGKGGLGIDALPAKTISSCACHSENTISKHTYGQYQNVSFIVKL